MSNFSISNLYDLNNTIAKDIFNDCKYPWEALSKIKDFIIPLGNSLDPTNYRKVDNNIWIHNTAIIAPTACIIGPAIIGKNAEVRHCAFIRGNAIVGDNCVVGNSTELKNVILFNNVQVPHYNYIGDSILGFHAHFGAGAITSNVKSDKKNIIVKDGNTRIETGLRKFGAIVGDNVEIGCGSVLNPGTVVGKNSNIYPLSSVRGVINENCIYKKASEIVEKI